MKGPASIILCVASFAALAPAQQPGASSNSENGIQNPRGKNSSQTVMVPRGTPVMLVSLDYAASDTTQKGSPVHLAVARDVVAQGVLLIPAGEPVTGIVTGTSGARAIDQNGHLKIRLNPVRARNGTRLRLVSSNPTMSPGALRAIGNAVRWTGICVSALPLCIGIEANAHTERRTHGSAFVPECGRLQFWTKSSAKLVLSPDPEPSQASHPPIEDLCPALADPHTDFTSHTPGVKFR